MTIPFTQYLRPNGRKQQGSKPAMTRPWIWAGTDEQEKLASEFIARGGWYECEELSTGHASLTACFIVDDEPQDIAIEVVMNGPAVVDAVDRLIRKSAKYEASPPHG